MLNAAFENIGLLLGRTHPLKHHCHTLSGNGLSKLFLRSRRQENPHVGCRVPFGCVSLTFFPSYGEAFPKERLALLSWSASLSCPLNLLIFHSYLLPAHIEYHWGSQPLLLDKHPVMELRESIGGLLPSSSHWPMLALLFFLPAFGELVGE